MLFSCKEKPRSTNTSDLEQFQLRGKVKSISEINYSGSGKYMNNITFNEKGWILEQNSLNPDGSLIRRWVNQYDDKNHKIKRYCYVMHDSLSYCFDYFYNEKGNLTAVNIRDKDTSSRLRNKIVYDSLQHKIEESSYGPNQNLENQIRYKYDKSSRLSEEYFFDTKKNFGWSQVHSYPENSKEENITFYSSDHILYKKITQIYSESQQPLEISTYDSHNKLTEKASYTYNMQGDATEIIEENFGENQKIIRTFSYTYDHRGNWTFQTEYKNSVVENLLTRNIVYYE